MTTILVQAGPHEGTIQDNPDMIRPIPEPATYGLWLVGLSFLLVLWAALLRKRRAR